MPTSKQIVEMIRSHSKGDTERFLLVVEEIASQADRSGKKKLAEDLLHAIKNARVRKGNPAVPIAQPRGELAGLVRVAYPEISLSDIALSPSLASKLRRIVLEHERRDQLLERGLAPRRKFLLQGPPGTGKSMSAAAIAAELSMPLFTVLLDGVITKYMGEAAAKLRIIFDSMRQTRAIYFFDEIDALATRRDNENDVGEARRTLNTLLLLLEEDKSNSLILAATNHASLLDPAIGRRFHASLKYQVPTTEEIEKVFKWNLLRFDTKNIEWGELARAAVGLSHADIKIVAEDAARDAILEHDGKITTSMVLNIIRERTA